MTEPKEAVRTVSDYLNNMCVVPEEFVQEMECEHRTLQQKFTELCFLWIKHNARKEELQYDGRNEYTVKMCKEINNAVDLPDRMPFI